MKDNGFTSGLHTFVRRQFRHEADIFADDYLDLSPWSFEASIIHISGHIEGSQTVIVGNEAIVGDCFSMCGEISIRLLPITRRSYCNHGKNFLIWELLPFIPNMAQNPQ